MDNDQPAIAYQNKLHLLLNLHSLAFSIEHAAIQEALDKRERVAGIDENISSLASTKLKAYGDYVMDCFEHFEKNYRTFIPDIPHIPKKLLPLSRHSNNLPPYDPGVYTAFLEKALCDQVLWMEDYTKFIHEEFPDFPSATLKSLTNVVYQHRIDAERAMDGRRIEDVASNRVLRREPIQGMDRDLGKHRSRLNSNMNQLYLTYANTFLPCFTELVDVLKDDIADNTLPHLAEKRELLIDELSALKKQWEDRFDANLFYPPAALTETFGANVAPEDNSIPFVHHGDLGLRRAIDRGITAMGEGLNAINEKVQASSLVPLESKQAMAQAMLDMQEASQKLFKRPFGGRSSNGGIDR
jgi:hypothetical protein